MKRTFTGDLPIISTTLPQTATAGQAIEGRVRFGLTSISGQVEFKQFLMKMTATNTWSISAMAKYTDWYTEIGMPVMWEMDTTISVPTSAPGIYYLRFYNKQQLVAVDTVIVQ